MPTEGDMLVTAHGKAWSGQHDDYAMLVLERQPLVVTVVGEAPRATMLTLANAMPEPPPPSWTDRVGSTCDRVMRRFSLAG